MRKYLPICVLLLLAALTISACSSSAEETPVAEPTPIEQATMEEEKQEASNETMEGEDAMEEEEDMGESMEKEGDDGKKDDEMDGEKMDEAPENDAEMGDTDKMSDDDAMTDGDGTMKEEDTDQGDSMAEDTKMENGEMAAEEMMEVSGLTLDVSGLEDLGAGWSYEGWLIVDGNPVSTGVFTVDAEMMASAKHFEVTDEILAAATTFVLTIEPSPDDDPTPSAVHILAGDFDGDSAALSVAHKAALGKKFTKIDSTYILGIPTSNSKDDSYTSGVWFDGLKLPKLPGGWVYEGWVVGPDGPITTGRFTKVNAADSDGAGPTAGPKPGPALVGQDFLNPAIDLTSGYAAVISIEPEPDNSPAPFTLKPLLDDTIEDEGDHVAQALANNTAGFPTGIVSRTGVMMEEGS